MTDPLSPMVSIIIPCLNEARYIEGCLLSVLAQEELPNGNSFEVIVADGMSYDGTREIVRRFAQLDPRVRLMDNPKQIVATAMNLAVRSARGDVIVRMDAHTEYASDYVKRCVEVLQGTAAANVGGPARTKALGYIQKANSLAYHSKFSVGGARFHDETYEGWVDTVPYGCWRKETLEAIGLFDEGLPRNEDDELNFRIVLSGGRIRQSPEIVSWYYPRRSLRRLAGQYMQYGYWKVRVVQKHASPAAIRHVVPALFLGSMMTLGMLSLFDARFGISVAALVLSYLGTSLTAGFMACGFGKNLKYLPVMPIVFAAYHFGYGYGFLAGLVDFVILGRSEGRSAFVESSRKDSHEDRFDLSIGSSLFPEHPFVSVVVPCRNEERYIANCLRTVLMQEEVPDAAGFEVIIADGMSDDGTREIVQAFRDPRVRMIDNPRHIVSTGLNLAIKAARGDVIVRMDAHTEYAPDYVRRCVEILENTAAENVGGPARTKAAGYVQKANSLAYHSKFSVGGARFHDETYEGYVDTVAYGCWLKETLEKIGAFDEQLVRNQDDELNLRTIRLGGRVWQSPVIRSWYFPRDSVGKLFRQYFRYGYWKVRVIRKHWIPASWRHLIPVTFLMCLFITCLLGLFHNAFLHLFTAMTVCYVAVSTAASAIVCRSPENWRYFPIMPLIFGAYHFGYGAGFIAGIVDSLRGNSQGSGAPVKNSSDRKAA